MNCYDKSEFAGKSKIEVIEAALLKNVAGGVKGGCQIPVCSSIGQCSPGSPWDFCAIDICIGEMEPPIDPR